MKKYLALFIIIALFVGIVYATTTMSTAYKTTKNTQGVFGNIQSNVQGLTATGTGNQSEMKVGTLFGKAYSVEIIGVGDSAFTVTITHDPLSAAGTPVFPSKVTKFTKTVSAASGDYAFETTSVNSNIAIGATFTGDVYVTVTDFSGTAWYVNVITEKTSQPAQDITY